MQKYKTYIIVGVSGFLAGIVFVFCFRLGDQGSELKQIRADINQIKSAQSAVINRLGTIENGIGSVSVRVTGVSDRIGKVESRIGNIQSGAKTSSGLIREGLEIIKTTRMENQKAKN